MKTIINLLVCIVALIAASCTNNEANTEIEYVPFQEKPLGKWGMIAPDGTVLVNERFIDDPTMAYNGRFMARNENGFWEIYTTEKEPKKVGNEYLYVTSFMYGVALAVEKGQPITLIDRDAHVLKELDQLDGNKVERMGSFTDGVAVFETESGRLGGINTQGDVVIQPDYCYLSSMGEGKFLAVEFEYKDSYQRNERDKFKYTILDKDKGRLFDCNGATYNVFHRFHGGIEGVSVMRDDQVQCGFIDEKANGF